jgi:type IV pilus assembly protein PilE
MNTQKGLTLVELMVVVAVLSILASIAYPLYTNQTQKARRADAKIALETIAMAQERLYTVQGSYASAVSNGTLQLSTTLAAGNTEEGYYTVAITGGGQTYSVRATKSSTGAQASDNDCDWFQIDQTGLKTAEDADGTNCW